MALIVEDGSIVANANSYATRAYIIAYAAMRAVTLPDTVATDANAIAGMDYLLRYNSRWKGEEIEPGVQTLAWPRKRVCVGSYHFPEDEIPASLMDAQSQLAIYSSQGISLLPVSGQSSFIKREKLGPLETEYSEAVQLVAGSTPTLPAIEGLLSGLLDFAGRLRTVRI